MEKMADGPAELLILDFDGVCTFSTAELMAGPAPSSPTGSNGTMSWSEVIRPETTDIVAAARRSGVVTVILSNEISQAWADEIPLLGDVDHVVACSDNGILKPDRRAFQRCLLLTGHRADATVVVDDHPDNVAVARSLGMRAVLFDPADPAAGWERVMAKLTGG